MSRGGRTAMAVAAATVALVGGCTSGSRTNPDPASSPAPGMITRSYEVRPGLEIHTWSVAGRSHAPWAAYVHGGSWYLGSGTSPRARQWAAHEVLRGYQVFGIDYRLSGQARWPAQRADVAASVEWVRAHADRFGIALGRGVIVGESAGGQLASIEAERGHFAAVADLAGAVDPPALLSGPWADLRRATRRYVGCTPAACPRVWQQTRAINSLDRTAPPFLIVHSVHDPVVPVSISRTFATELRAKGVRVTLRVVPGPAHPLMLLPSVLPHLDAFLDRAVR